MHAVFREKQVYRIDHYLGKETVQNILVLRFANTIFEPVWNRNYIDHVQITVAEEVTVGRRGGFYDADRRAARHVSEPSAATADDHGHGSAGALRGRGGARRKGESAAGDHAADARATSPRDTLRGQYRGYRQEPGVAPDSQTATFAAVKLAIDNWRWQGVPFYLRSGKAMSCRTTQIVIQFRSPPHMVFGRDAASMLRRQSAGDPDPAGRGHSAALSDQGARRGHEAAADRSGLQLPARVSQA